MLKKFSIKAKATLKKNRLISFLLLILFITSLLTFLFRDKLPYLESKDLALITLRSDQKNVSVWLNQNLDNKKTSFLPQKFKLTAGKYEFEFFKQGFETQTLVISVEKNEKKEIKINLEPKNIVGEFYELFTDQSFSSLGWSQDNKLFYQTGQAVRYAWKNESLLTLPDDKPLIFSQKGLALGQTSQKIFFIKPPSPEIIEKDLLNEKVFFSKNGEYLAYTTLKDKKSLFISSINNLEERSSFSLPENFQINQVDWALNYRSLLLFGLRQNNFEIYLCDFEKNTFSQIFTGQEKIFSPVLSPSGQKIAFVQNDSLQTISLSGEKNSFVTFEKEFSSEKLLENISFWINEEELLVVNKIIHHQDIKEDLFYLVNTTIKTKKLFATSAPLINKIDFSVTPALSPNQKALAVKEKDGSLWVLLISGKIQEFFPEMVD